MYDNRVCYWLNCFRTEESSNIQQDYEDLDDSCTTDQSVSNNDLPPRVCFICEKTRKRFHGREVCLAVSRLKTTEYLKNAATEYNDIPMLEKLSSFSKYSDIPYHKCCKDQYVRRISREENGELFI